METNAINRLEKSGAKSRVFVADDHPLFRAALVELINREPDMCSCGEAATAGATVQAVLEEQPDVLTLDLRFSDGSGLDIIRALKDHCAHLGVLVVTQSDDLLFAERAVRAGALGYLTKDEAAQEVREAIRTVIQGQMYVSRKIATRVVQKWLQEPAREGCRDVARLSDRELRIFEMIGAGQTTRDIATSLSLSVKTVEAHRETIKGKLGLPNAASLRRRAAQWVGRGPETSDSSQRRSPPTTAIGG